nr:hypothetical protein [Frankia sp. ArI3]
MRANRPSEIAEATPSAASPSACKLVTAAADLIRTEADLISASEVAFAALGASVSAIPVAAPIDGA